MAVMNVAVDAMEFDYDFPPTTDYLVHGICAQGLTVVSANSNLNGLTYDLVEDFQDGMQLWPKDTTDALHGQLVGEGGFCEGGTYIQPSKHNGIPKNTIISIQGLLPRGTEAKLCYFVESGGVNRDGGWGQLPDFEYVKDYQWDANRVTDIFGKGWLGSAKIYCRTIVNEDKSEDKGINLFSSAGSTDYPSGAVKVVSSDTSTVTVQLRQTWGATVDKFFYQYKSGLFSQQCFQENDVEPDTIVDTITIQCKLMYPVAYLKLCLQDTTGALLDPAGDQGTVPRCCHSDAPPDTPTVCYSLAINCSGNIQRSLRGLAV